MRGDAKSAYSVKQFINMKTFLSLKKVISEDIMSLF